MATVILIFQQYLVPLLFAIGLIYFIWGVINYFFFEGYEAVGREAFVRACSWLVVALVAHLFTFGLIWLSGLSSSTPDGTPHSSSPPAGVEVEERDSFLPTPNVPRR